MNKETKTTTTDIKLSGSVLDLSKYGNDIHKVEAPLFILFAEYLGYVSQFNKLAEKWCDGTVPEVHVQMFMKLEAKCIFRQMLKDYELDDIRYFYDSYYPLILKEYEDGLAKIVIDD
jgi:hypothetical protein